MTSHVTGCAQTVNIMSMEILDTYSKIIKTERSGWSSFFLWADCISIFLIFGFGKIEFDINAIVYQSLTFMPFQRPNSSGKPLIVKLPFNFYFSKMNKSLVKKNLH